jgi:transposase-like protein
MPVKTQGLSIPPGFLLTWRWHYLVEMMAERSLSNANTATMRWVERHIHWRSRGTGSGLPGQPWRVDRTYAKIRGECRYRTVPITGRGRSPPSRSDTVGCEAA